MQTNRTQQENTTNDVNAYTVLVVFSKPRRSIRTFVILAENESECRNYILSRFKRIDMATFADTGVPEIYVERMKSETTKGVIALWV